MAKILIVSHDGVGHWFALRFLKEGHSVDIHWCGKASNKGIYACDGLVPTPSKETPDFRKYNLVLFDSTDKPKLSDLSAVETPTLGDSSFATTIENDRLVGIQAMEECGINVPAYESFNDIGEAKRFVRKMNKRYVFKPFGGPEQDTASTYVSKDAEDMLRYLDKLGTVSKGAGFIMQEVVSGTEISTEGWFNGEDFYLLNGTLEEKKFMDGGHGPNTGCSGNLVFVYDELNPPLIFKEGLQKMKDFLKHVGYHGMIDLNTIVSDREIYGLEWTPRLGYDASATLFHIISSDLAEFMHDVSTGQLPHPRIKNPYAASVRISIPPYPTEIEGKHPEGLPVQGLEDEKELYRTHYLYDVVRHGDDLLTGGINGFIMAPIASGATIQEAFAKLDGRVKRIQIPNMQYRTDIQKSVLNRYNTLSSQGWLR